MSDTRQRYQQVVHALLEGDPPPGEQLLVLREDAAYVAMGDNSVAVIIRPSKRGAELAAVIDDQLRAEPFSHFKLVIIGGGHDMREVLAGAQPGLLARRMVQVYHLADDGTVWGGRRSSLDSPMGRVLQAVAGGEGSPAASFAALAGRVVEVPRDERDAARRHYRFVMRFRGRRPRLTIGLLVALLVVFGLQIVWGGSAYVPTLMRMGANSEASLHGEPWRLLASVCLHGGEEHFILNCVVLYILGGQLERIIGWARLAILLVVSGLVGSIGSALLSDAALSVGASGAIWGVLGAAAVISLRPGELLPPGVVHRMRRASAINLVICLAASLLPGVDLWAHLGGGLGGAALALAGVLTRGLAPLEEQSEAPPPQGRSLRAGAGAGLAVLAASLATAVVVGKPWVLTRAPSLETRDVGGFVVDVPAPLGDTRRFETPGGYGVDIGDALMDPISVVMEVHPHERPLTDAELAEAGDWYFDIETAAPDGASETEDRRTIEDAQVPTFEETAVFPNGLRLVTRYAYHRTAQVTTSVTLWTGTHDTWVLAAERLRTSVRPAPEAP